MLSNVQKYSDMLSDAEKYWEMLNSFSISAILINVQQSSAMHKNTEGFLTPDSFHSTSLETWGSSMASKEAKFIKEFDFLGFSRCFSAKIEQSSTMSKTWPNCVILGWFFEFCLILSEKQQLKPKKSKSLMNFASLDTQLDSHVARIAKTYPVLHFVLKS